MSHADRSANNGKPLFHPVSHYGAPADVLNDAKLSVSEKRVILSSWASDMYVVESYPALREVPGIPHRLRLDDILAALKKLDDEDDPPPRGGLAMRLPRLGQLDGIAPGERQRVTDRHATTRRYRPVKAVHTHPRWTRAANVQRYRKLLNTQLTDIERNFIEWRLAEELHG